jgi:hypothetical protein
MVAGLLSIRRKSRQKLPSSPCAPHLTPSPAMPSLSDVGLHGHTIRQDDSTINRTDKIDC